jgi:hypothetical protein
MSALRAPPPPPRIRAVPLPRCAWEDRRPSSPMGDRPKGGGGGAPSPRDCSRLGRDGVEDYTAEKTLRVRTRRS